MTQTTYESWTDWLERHSAPPAPPPAPPLMTADQYQREQIASAQSEDAYQANVREYNK